MPATTCGAIAASEAAATPDFCLKNPEPVCKRLSN
jgi:hypothetical protein